MYTVVSSIADQAVGQEITFVSRTRVRYNLAKNSPSTLSAMMRMTDLEARVERARDISENIR